MKMSFWDRALVALFAIIGIALAVLCALRAFGADLIGCFMDGLTNATRYGRYIVVGIAAVIVLLGVVSLVFMFRRSGKRQDRSFVVIDSSDKGRVRIAMSAIEEMVRRAIGNLEGASDLKIGVHNEEDAVSISVDTSVAAGEHVPTVTLNMQRGIREYVEANCGIAVRGVSVTISAVNGSVPVAPAAPILRSEPREEAPEEPARQSAWPFDEPTEAAANAPVPEQTEAEPPQETEMEEYAPETQEEPERSEEQ